MHFESLKMRNQYGDGGSVQSYSEKLYHGDGDKVNVTYGSKTDEGLGDFWTNNKTMAEWFAGISEYSVNTSKYEPTNRKGNVIEKVITIENPYIIDSSHPEYDIDNEVDSWQILMDEMNAKTKEEVQIYANKLISQGYDGIILKDNVTNYYSSGTYDIIVKFTDEQLKNANLKSTNSSMYKDGGNLTYGEAQELGDKMRFIKNHIKEKYPQFYYGQQNNILGKAGKEIPSVSITKLKKLAKEKNDLILQKALVNINEKMEDGGSVEGDLTKLPNLENYVNANKAEIKANRKTYGFMSIAKITNPYDFSSLLGVDSRIFRNAEIPYYARFVADLLKNAKMKDGGNIVLSEPKKVEAIETKKQVVSPESNTKTSDFKIGDQVIEYRKDPKFASGYFEGKVKGKIIYLFPDGLNAKIDFSPFGPDDDNVLISELKKVEEIETVKPIAKTEPKKAAAKKSNKATSKKTIKTSFKVGDKGLYDGRVKENIVISKITSKLVYYTNESGKNKNASMENFTKFFISQ